MILNQDNQSVHRPTTEFDPEPYYEKNQTKDIFRKSLQLNWLEVEILI